MDFQNFLDEIKKCKILFGILSQKYLANFETYDLKIFFKRTLMFYYIKLYKILLGLFLKWKAKTGKDVSSGHLSTETGAFVRTMVRERLSPRAFCLNFCRLKKNTVSSIEFQ